MTDTVLYEEMRPETFRARIAEAPIAYLPLGTLEWHGEHLPLGSDGLQSQGFFIELARLAGGIVLPMLFLGPDRSERVDGKEFYGMDTYDQPHGGGFTQLDGSAYWANDELFEDILKAVLKQLRRAGFRIVVGHGHAPSKAVFQRNIEQWGKEFDLELFVCSRDNEKDGLGIQTDHAAANETSLVMALRPELVKMDNLSPDPDDWPFGVGGQDPRTHASAQVGHQAIEMQGQRMAKILAESLAKLGNDS